jgi:hypothetical protein
MRRLIISIILILTVGSARAQSLENMGAEKPVQVSGSFNATTIGYAAYGIQSRREPYNWFLNGGINLSLYGWSIPLSFTWSNQSRTFSQPFNQYGVAPEYKWAKAYLGYNSMSFSKYSLAGHIFLGAGAELTPGKFRISTMYGRLNKGTSGDSLSHVDPIFKRMSAGFKIGYTDGRDAIDLILFSAWDDPASLSGEVAVKPQENVVMSLIGRKSLTEKIYLTAEYALSGLSRDITNKSGGGEAKGMYRPLSFLLSNNASYFNAFNTSVNYNGKFYTLNVNFERIDPGYTTLGAYYFNNDMQNLTAGGSVRLFDQKLTLNSNIGTQRNNLDDTELSKTRRIISSLNLNYIPSASWNINTGYSNFTTFTNIRPSLNPFFQNELDTLNFYQINRSATATVSYTFGSKENRKSLFFTGNYQTSGDEQSDITVNTTFIMANIAYRTTVVPLNATLSVSANLNRNIMPDFETSAYGPNAGLSRTFLNKALRTSVSATFNRIKTNEQVSSKVMNFRLSGSYNVKKQHSFSLFGNILRKFGTAQNDEQFNEFSGTLNYGYSF